MTATGHLGLPYIDAAQSQKHLTHNDALRALDTIVQLSVLNRTLTAPPATPAANARYLIASGATGAFAGYDGTIAAFQDGAWAFAVPQTGWRLYVEAESAMLVFDGTLWRDLGWAVHTLDNLAHCGVGTSADASNPLSAKLNAALFTARGVGEGGSGDLRYKLNKEAAGNVLSQLYQTNYSGRAEVGLLGNDHFHLKVSGDGALWKDALDVDPASGVVSFPNGTSGAGAQIFSTAGIPAAGTGNNGDIAIDAAAKTLYPPKTAGAWPTGLGLGGLTLKRIDVFNLSGTFTKQAGDVLYHVLMNGGGGGGGSGARATAGLACGGGAGGSPGAAVDIWVHAADFAATITVTVGAGGTGGAIAADSAAGNAGGTGGASIFGGYYTYYGTGGGAGTLAAGGVASVGILGYPPVSIAGGAGSFTSNGATGTIFGSGATGHGGRGAGGGGGAAITAANAVFSGAVGHTPIYWNVAMRPAAGTAGTAGASGGAGGNQSSSSELPGGGGGGGASSITADTGNGGNGGLYGAGGGGGAAGRNGFFGGKGGDGAQGRVIVFVYG